eukprot:TRINITY_DN12009_c0_g2_i2.p1 TRINITY_DN12009_c0_g2~~TRINITY_DN12009_c0_g2_i2.p1  ORF type:complete len:483 (+),score=126.15 TRINITY_DN12009_c0_g2_i2:59-1507(+)
MTGSPAPKHVDPTATAPAAPASTATPVDPVDPALPLFRRAALEAARALPLAGPWDVAGEAIPTKKRWEKAEVTPCSATFYRGKTVVIPASETKKQQQVELAQLHDCRVVVLGSCGNYMVDDCTNCEFVLGPCSGSLFIRDCTDLCITAACQQLRMRDLNNAEFFIHTETDPCVEASSNIVLRPLNVRLPGLKEAFAEVKLRAHENRFRHAADFSRFVDTTKEDGFSLPPYVGVLGMRTTDLSTAVHGPLTVPDAVLEILVGTCKGGESLENGTFHLGEAGRLDQSAAEAVHREREAKKAASPAQPKGAGAPSAKSQAAPAATAGVSPDEGIPAPIAAVAKCFALWASGKLSPSQHSKEEVLKSLAEVMTADYVHDPCDGNTPFGWMKPMTGLEAFYEFLVNDEALFERSELKMGELRGQPGSNVVKVTANCVISAKTKPGVSLPLQKEVHYFVGPCGKIARQEYHFPAGAFAKWQAKFEPLM